MDKWEAAGVFCFVPAASKFKKDLNNSRGEDPEMTQLIHRIIYPKGYYHASGALVDMTSNQNAPSTKKMVIMIG
jgi:hypothetical protein